MILGLFAATIPVRALAADEALAKLHEACRCSDFAGLPTQPVDVRAIGEGAIRKAALHWAVEGMATRPEERLRVVQWVLDHGADVNQISGEGLTPLQHACRDGWDRPLLDLLFSRGADVDAPGGKPSRQNPGLGTALHRAAERRDPELIAYLLEKKANTGSRAHPRHQSPLHTVFFRAHSGEAEKMQARTIASVKLLLQAGADPNVRDMEGWTALHRAALAGHYEGMKELIAHKAAIDARTANGSTVLHSAVFNSARFDRRVLDLLVGRDEKLLNVANSDGNTALHVAVRQNNGQAVQALLLMRADPSIQNKQGARPIDLMDGDIDDATQEMLDRYTPVGKKPEPKKFDPSVI